LAPKFIAKVKSHTNPVLLDLYNFEEISQVVKRSGGPKKEEV